MHSFFWQGVNPVNNNVSRQREHINNVAYFTTTDISSLKALAFQIKFILTAWSSLTFKKSVSAHNPLSGSEIGFIRVH